MVAENLVFTISEETFFRLLQAQARIQHAFADLEKRGINTPKEWPDILEDLMVIMAVEDSDYHTNELWEFLNIPFTVEQARAFARKFLADADREGRRLK